MTDLKNQAIVEINNKLGLITSQSINTNSYLDFLQELLKNFNWQTSSWAQRIKTILQISEITINYYEEFINESDDNTKVQSLFEIATIGWNYSVEAFKIKVPMIISLFQDKIIRLFIEATYTKLKEKDLVGNILAKVKG